MPLRTFEEYVNSKIITKKSPDLLRAKSLIDEAKQRKIYVDSVLNKIGVHNENANYVIESCYDIIMEVIRSKLMINGYFSMGEAAHEAEISYLRNLKFREEDIRFLNDLRFFRNGILYYGKKFDKDYAEKVVKFMNENYDKLLRL